jgi:hypothetical protein
MERVRLRPAPSASVPVALETLNDHCDEEPEISTLDNDYPRSG